MDSPQNQTAQSRVLQDIEDEVSQENAPLLQFIVRHGGKIAAFVIIFLLVAVASGLWQRYVKNRQKETREQIASALLQNDSAAKVSALKSIADNAPDDMRLAACLELAQAALDSGDAGLAGAAYASAASAAGADSVMGRISKLGQATSLLRQGKGSEAMLQLRELEGAMPERPNLIRLLMADAAIMAGDRKLASQIYAELEKESAGPDAAWYHYRIEELSQVKNDASAPAQKQPAGESAK